MALRSTMKAYKAISPGVAKVVTVPLPKLRPDYVLVKVSAVALNPTDWKHIHAISKENATVGCDWVGTVVEVGSDVTKPFKKGDRITGVTHGVNHSQIEDGSFAEYAVVKGDIAIKVPDNITDEEAATLGVGVTTVGQGLYQTLQLPLPDQPSTKKDYVLIYGGSTTTGLLAIQFAKLSGFKVVTTCSPRNFDLVKKYGADEAFDYKDGEKTSAAIRSLTNDSLQIAFDTISTVDSATLCNDALSTSGGRYSNLQWFDYPRRDNVKYDYTLAYTIFGEEFLFRGGKFFPAKKEDFEFGVKFWELSRKLLAEGKLKLPPLDVRKGGLEAIHEGLDDLKENRVSGKKIVYPLGSD